MTASKNTKKLTFEGEKLFIGIDTHKKNWKVCIHNQLMFLKKFSMNPNPTELLSFLNRNYPGGNYFSVYEAGFCGFHIHRKLVSLGINNIIVNPADVPTTYKEKNQKSDPIDCNKLSRELKNNSLTGIYIPDINLESLRSLGRYRKQVYKRSTQIKCRIKSLLNFVGIATPKDIVSQYWSKNYINWLKKTEFESSNYRMILDNHIEDFEYNRVKKLSLLRKIRKEFRETEICKYLTSVPGIGLLSAFIIYSELLDIKRFKKLDYIASFIGLIPSTKSSGEKEVSIGITIRCVKEIRRIMIQAAWVAVRVDPALTLAFIELTKRMPKQKAIIKVARKLLNRIRYVWLNKTTYELGTIE